MVDEGCCGGAGRVGGPVRTLTPSVPPSLTHTPRPNQPRRQPAEDLVLEGSHKTLLRVRANTPYSCIMMKTQRFASLFRSVRVWGG